MSSQTTSPITSPFRLADYYYTESEKFLFLKSVISYFSRFFNKPRLSFSSSKKDHYQANLNNFQSIRMI
ncbi:MAG: hypothetical protein KAR35_06640 [Candidatus Heimdallarchaeota archaeon]|nr:hypothetical protein [Candidatus Heimdallarchaeota archaeon]MCK5049036.1 hypothetical protein [Candidatus Heimdallarchaeota archaeon]